MARFQEALRTWISTWALPQRCVLCAEPGSSLCEPCRNDLPGLTSPRCPVCADTSVSAQICGACLSDPPHFSKVHAPVSYAFPVNQMIRRLKYGADLSLIEPLASLVAQQVANDIRPDCVIAMPLSSDRLRERGFNQSFELARVLGSRLRVDVVAAGCRRTRHSPPQASLPWDERRANIRGAFECETDLGGARVAVVDDVMTSGATLNELARVLRRAGAAEVTGWIVARTERA